MTKESTQSRNEASEALTVPRFCELLLAHLHSRMAYSGRFVVDSVVLWELIEAAASGEEPANPNGYHSKRLTKRTREQRSNPYMDLELGPLIREEIRVVRSEAEEMQARKDGFTWDE